MSAIAQENSPNLENGDCSRSTVNQSLQVQFEKLKAQLESGYQSGLPSELKKNLIQIRDKNDEFALKAFDNQSSPQEASATLQNLLTHLESFIHLIPEITESAPKVRDQYLLPLSNLQISAMKQSCDENDKNKYQTVTEELDRLTSQLYDAQSLNPQKFVAYRVELQKLLQLSLNDPKADLKPLQLQAASIVHEMQLQVDKLLPSFQLSAQFSSL